MRVAVIKKGIVDNVVVGELSFISELYPDCACLAVGEAVCGPGMLCLDGSFVDNPNPELG